MSDGDDVRERLSFVERNRAMEGLYPYDGQWLSKEEIDQRIARSQRRSFVRLLQVGALLVVMTVVGLVMLSFLVALCY